MTELEDLIVDESALDREALATALHGLVGITAEGSIRQMGRWPALSERQKVVATLLGAKAAHALKRRDSDRLGPSELAAMSGVALGTVKPVLREKLASRTCAQSAEGSYYIPAWSLTKAIEELRPKMKKGREK